MTPPEELTPRKIVEELNHFIVGQESAKRTVAIALRNRYRRKRLSEGLREEVTPKNILMIGPTGVGKTEIARRLARLIRAPFLKVEATRFTEVGYVGRDVEAIIRDLVESAVRLVREERREEVAAAATVAAAERLLDLMVDGPVSNGNPWERIFAASEAPPADPERERRREGLRQRLQRGELEDQVVEMEVEEATPWPEGLSGPGGDDLGQSLQDLMGNLLPRRRRRRQLPVREARRLLENEEAQKLIDAGETSAEAISRAENDGIVFIDEIDKIAGTAREGPDVSREGVQRDILPIVEGATVQTRHGAVRTDHILFIAAGAFHVSKPSDLIPELQGRFPIRVELESLREEDLRRILVEPENSLVRQYQALLKADGVELELTPAALGEIAALAQQVNEATENIGARRLHTLFEKLLEDLSFEAPDGFQGPYRLDQDEVRRRLGPLVQDRELSRYIL